MRVMILALLLAAFLLPTSAYSQGNAAVCTSEFTDNMLFNTPQECTNPGNDVAQPGTVAADTLCSIAFDDFPSTVKSNCDTCFSASIHECCRTRGATKAWNQCKPFRSANTPSLDSLVPVNCDTMQSKCTRDCGRLLGVSLFPPSWNGAARAACLAGCESSEVVATCAEDGIYHPAASLQACLDARPATVGLDPAWARRLNCRIAFSAITFTPPPKQQIKIPPEGYLP